MTLRRPASLALLCAVSGVDALCTGYVGSDPAACAATAPSGAEAGSCCRGDGTANSCSATDDCACGDYAGSDAAVCASHSHADACCRINGGGACTDTDDCCPVTSDRTVCEEFTPGGLSALVDRLFRPVRRPYDFCYVVGGYCTAGETYDADDWGSTDGDPISGRKIYFKGRGHPRDVAGNGFTRMTAIGGGYTDSPPYYKGNSFNAEWCGALCHAKHGFDARGFRYGRQGSETCPTSCSNDDTCTSDVATWNADKTNNRYCCGAPCSNVFPASGCSSDAATCAGSAEGCCCGYGDAAPCCQVGTSGGACDWCECYGANGSTLGEIFDTPHFGDVTVSTYSFGGEDATTEPSSQPSEAPSGQPSSTPSEAPSGQPSSNPSEAPSGRPSSEPSRRPSSGPSEAPSAQPSAQPSRQPSARPSGQPSASPSAQPSGQPSAQPSRQPSAQPSRQPSAAPSAQPSNQPSAAPSTQQSAQPSAQPSNQPSSQPSESPSANPSQGCVNHRTDCGWGIFNPWTCRCDCPAGICLDDNEQCYTPCRETIHSNPWAGCSPGWDCPWYPDANKGHCSSSMHQPNHFEIYRTAQECCNEHYKNDDSCLEDSKAPWVYQHDQITAFPGMEDFDGHQPYPWPHHFDGTGEHLGNKPPKAYGTVGGATGWGQQQGNTDRWYPDLVNKLNCVFGDNWESWMNDKGFAEQYLFLSYEYNDTSTTPAGVMRDAGMEDCCEKWFPQKGDDCPDKDPFNPVNPEAEDEAWNRSPYPMQHYYFPDFAENSCGFGWDYPAWMGWSRYEKYYLFRPEDADACCDRFFPNVGNCPYERHTDVGAVKTGYYWESYQENLPNGEKMPTYYNHTYWPDIHDGTCVNGTDYPAWMASDVDFIRMYLFETLEGCCNKWFTETGLDECVDNVHQGSYEPTQFTFYPDIDAKTCVNGTNYPSWMGGTTGDDEEDAEYREKYLFGTLERCCVAWFAEDGLDDCVDDVVQGSYAPAPCDLEEDEGCEETLQAAGRDKWYPDLDGYECKQDRALPSWMLKEDYREWYLFPTEEQCCAAFGYCEDRS